MRARRKTKTHAKRRAAPFPESAPRTRQIYGRRRGEEEGPETFTAMETGQPDQNELPDIDNPMAVQGGRGPLNQEGEGERQNAQLAELEQIEPDIDLDKKPS